MSGELKLTDGKNLISSTDRVELAGTPQIPCVFKNGEFEITAKETILKGPIVIEDGAVLRVKPTA